MMRHRRRAGTVREWFTAQVAGVRTAFEELSAPRSFDDQLDRLLGSAVMRERFKSAVMMFAQVGLTVDEVENLADGAVRGRVSIAGVPLMPFLARHEACRCAVAEAAVDPLVTDMVIVRRAEDGQLSVVARHSDEPADMEAHAIALLLDGTNFALDRLGRNE